VRRTLEWYCEHCGGRGVLALGDDIDTKQCDACGELIVPG